jgi:hypothetical protein
VAKRPEALLCDKVLLEDHIADEVVLTRGNGVLAAFSADGVFPDTADDTDIAAEDVELTVYQCRGEADPSGYQAGRHRVRFARELDAASRDSVFRGLLYANRLFLGSRCVRRRQQRRASDGSWPRRVRILAAGKGRARRTLHATALGCLFRSVAVARPAQSVRSAPTHWP